MNENPSHSAVNWNEFADDCFVENPQKTVNSYFDMIPEIPEQLSEEGGHNGFFSNLFPVHNNSKGSTIPRYSTVISSSGDSSPTSPDSDTPSVSEKTVEEDSVSCPSDVDSSVATQPGALQRIVIPQLMKAQNVFKPKTTLKADNVQTPCCKIEGVSKSEANHPASAKRKRTRVACSSCHKAKSACDSNRPCGRCIRLQRPESCRDRPHKLRPVKQRKEITSSNESSPKGSVASTPRRELIMSADESMSHAFNTAACNLNVYIYLNLCPKGLKTLPGPSSAQMDKLSPTERFTVLLDFHICLLKEPELGVFRNVPYTTSYVKTNMDLDDFPFPIVKLRVKKTAAGQKGVFFEANKEMTSQLGYTSSDIAVLAMLRGKVVGNGSPRSILSGILHEGDQAMQHILEKECIFQVRDSYQTVVRVYNKDRTSLRPYLLVAKCRVSMKGQEKEKSVTMCFTPLMSAKQMTQYDTPRAIYPSLLQVHPTHSQQVAPQQYGPRQQLSVSNPCNDTKANAVAMNNMLNMAASTLRSAMSLARRPQYTGCPQPSFPMVQSNTPSSGQVPFVRRPPNVLPGMVTSGRRVVYDPSEISKLNADAALKALYTGKFKA